MGIIDWSSGVCSSDLFLPSFGVLCVGGIIAFLLGGLFLTDTGIPGFDLSIPFLIGLAVVSAGLIMAIGVLAARVHKRKVVGGREDMLGVVGMVTSTKGGMIYADVRGESWRVSCSETLSPGDKVKIVAMDGLVLQIGRAHVGTPVTNAHLVCRLLLEKKK